MTFEQMLNERGREGEAIGFEKGRSEGVAQEKREIAKNLKEIGVGMTEIIKATGLSKEEVEALQSLPVISLFKNTQMTMSA